MFSFHFLKALTAQTNHNLTLSPLQGLEHLLQKAVQKMIPRDVQQQLMAYIFVHIILRTILGFTDKKRKQQQQQYCRN